MTRPTRLSDASFSRFAVLPLALGALAGCADADGPSPAVGTLDATFGVDGIADLDLGAGYASALARHGDGLVGCATLLVDGGTGVSVFRLNLDGSPDLDFGPQGAKVFTHAESDACVGLAVAPDGTIAALMRTPSGDALALRQPEGTWSSPLPIGEAMQSFRSITADTAGFLLAGRAMVNQVSRPAVRQVSATDGTGVTSIATNLEGESYRAFRRGDGGLDIVARISGSGSPEGWTVVHSSDGVSGFTDLGFHVNRGEGITEDLLLDAVRHEDGTLVAVGSVDAMTAVEATVFALGEPPSATTHSYVHGGPSGAYGAVADEGGLTLMVGQGSAAGTTLFAWSRLSADGGGLDPGFANAGWNEAPTPNGTPGELIAATIGSDGAYYALGHYDLAATPKLVLVRIVR